MTFISIIYISDKTYTIQKTTKRNLIRSGRKRIREKVAEIKLGEEFEDRFGNEVICEKIMKRIQEI